MYNYFFAVIYNWAFESGKGKWLSKQHACNAVFFALFVHLVFVLEILRTYFGVKFNQISVLNKNIVIVAIVLFFIVVRLFYTTARITRLQGKYLDSGKIKEYSKWIVFAVALVPLVISIIIGKKA